MPGIALFPTPLFVFHPPEGSALCDEVTALLLAERQRDPDRDVRNDGGSWHSAPDLAGRPDEIWQRVAQEFVDGVGAAFREFAAWGTVMPPGAYSTLHEHHEAHWSAVFYADVGDPGPPPSGALALVDPRRVPPACAGVMLYPSTFTLQPENGMLVVFPSWLQRYVHPYDGTRPQVSVAANIHLERR
ncbi:MAG: hypothetical protein JRI25_14605 [Deltaproteobacteria bacterium]|nr:hypothetical protein [Deltaproteobacteria bacterium]